MEFNYEHEMVESAAAWLRKQEMMIKPEYPTPWGICDLVGCRLEPERVAKRLAHGQRKSIGPRFRIGILGQIPDVYDKQSKSISLNQLIKLFDGYSEQELLKELDSLRKNKFVIPGKRKNTFQQKNGWKPLQRRLIAIELKLSRIEEVYFQASNNRVFADDSYVGLPLERAVRLSEGPRVRQFQESGIGILGLTPQECRVVLEPGQTDKIDNVVQMHVVEQFWRMHLKDRKA